MAKDLETQDRIESDWNMNTEILKDLSLGSSHRRNERCGISASQKIVVPPFIAETLRRGNSVVLCWSDAPRYKYFRPNKE